MCCEKVKEKNIRITAMNHETQEVKVYLISVWHFKQLIYLFIVRIRKAIVVNLWLQ